VSPRFQLSSPIRNRKQHLKAELAQEIAEKTAPTDDPMYVELHGKYIGAILFDFKTRSSVKLFRIVAIQFDRSYTASRFDCWEATCEPVYRNSATRHFTVPLDAKVDGSNVTMKHALQSYALAEYPTRTEGEPTYLPWVDQYIDHFRNVVQPKYASLFLDSPSTEKNSPSTNKDLPSYHQKDLPSSTMKDLPSTRSRKCRKN
jgi:hypothetical protein